MKILWRREWLPTPVFLPEEFYGQRRLVSYSPWGCKESDMTEQLTNSWLTMFQEHSKVIYKSFSSPVAFKHGCSLEIYLVSGLSVSHSVISDSLESHGLWPARLLHPWDSPGRNTGGVAIPLPGNLSNPRIKPGSSALQADSLLSEPPGNLYFKKFQDSSDMHLSNSYCLSRSRWLSVPLNEAWKPNSGTPSSVNSWSFHIEQINPYSVRLLIYMHISIIAPIILLTYQLFPVILWACCCYLVTKSCLTLCNHLDCSPPGSSVNGIFQVRILEG